MRTKRTRHQFELRLLIDVLDMHKVKLQGAADRTEDSELEDELLAIYGEVHRFRNSLKKTFGRGEL